MSFFKIHADLEWAHAVNSRESLQNALYDDRFEMIEADVLVGTLSTDPDGSELPIMAHPPNETSDLSLSMFLHDVIKYNKRYFTGPKGVKLDFKSIEAFEMSLPLLNAIIPVTCFPIWLNADIVEGPVHPNNVIPVDPDRFLQGCFPFKEIILSVGWTTNWSSAVQEGDYSANYIEAMIKVLQSNNIPRSKHRLTFPVRAGIAANSKDVLKRLLDVIEDTNDCTLTIWSSPNDYVDVEKLSDLIHAVGKGKVYLDLPEELQARLRLAQSKRSQRWMDSWPAFILLLALAVGVMASALYFGKKPK